MRQLNSSNEYGSGSKTTKGEGGGAGFKAKKKLVFLRLPKWKFSPKKLEWLIIIIIIIIYLFIYLFNFFGNFDAVGLSWPNVVEEIISRKFIKLFFI